MQIEPISKDKAVQLAASGLITQQEAANLSGYSHQRISQLVRDIKTNPDHKEFVDKKADILEALQGKIVDFISDEDIKKASLQQKIISTSVLQDKIEQIRGVSQSLSDNQINVLINNVVNNYVVKDTHQPEIIDVSDVPPEIAKQINEL